MSNILTIVTTTFNNPRDFEKTFTSASLALSNLKTKFSTCLIVVDSSDTLDILKSLRRLQHDSSFSSINYIYEKPSGPYNAMNTGIYSSSSKYIWILNSGDEILSLPEDFLFTLTNCNQPLFGRVKKSLFDGNSYGRSQYSSFFDFRLHELHPTCILPLKIYQKLGTYDISFKVAADLNLLLKVARKYTFLFVPDILVYYPAGGISSHQNESLSSIFMILLKSRYFRVIPFFLARYIYSLLRKFF